MPDFYTFKWLDFSGQGHLQRRGAQTETVEGIRALAIDKQRQPKWQPERIEDVTSEMVGAFFVIPWPAQAHPLRQLA